MNSKTKIIAVLVVIILGLVILESEHSVSTCNKKIAGTTCEFYGDHYNITLNLTNTWQSGSGNNTDIRK
jgi:hypothetical protein